MSVVEPDRVFWRDWAVTPEAPGSDPIARAAVSDFKTFLREDRILILSFWRQRSKVRTLLRMNGHEKRSRKFSYGLGRNLATDLISSRLTLQSSPNGEDCYDSSAVESPSLFNPYTGESSMNTRTFLAVGLLGAGLAISFSPRTHAQDNVAPSTDNTTAPRRLRLNPTPGTRPIADELNLTVDQRPKFDAEMQDFQAKMRALQEDHDKKIAAILTPAQADQYRQLQAQMRGNRGFGGANANNRGGGNRGGFGNPQAMLDQMKTELALTPDQVTQISKIFDENRTKTQALRGQNLDQQAMRTQMQVLRQDRTDKINAVLTADQKAKYATMMQNFRGRGNRGGGGGFGNRGNGGGNAGGGNGGTVN